MDSSLLNEEILKVIYTNKVINSRAKYTWSSEPEDKDLIGFIGGTMVFKKEGMVESNKTYEKVTETITEKHSLSSMEDFEENKKKNSDESLSGNENSAKDTNTQEMKTQNVFTESNGKKYIYLNGQKLQIIKHSSNVPQSNTDVKTLNNLPKILPKLTKAQTLNKKDTKFELLPPKCQSASINFNTQQVISISTKCPRNISPKLTGKIISMNKNEGFQNLSLIMKEVGGCVRLVNNHSSNVSQGIPPLKENIKTGGMSTAHHIVRNGGRDSMECCHCSCNKMKNVVVASTNTPQIRTQHKSIQTEDPQKLNSGDSESENLISDLYIGGVIIGDDVNMGHGPPPIYKIKENNIKMQFFQDLNRCLKWESGNLPIHRGVIQQNLQEVKKQCVVLKARKAGINIANINDYTPLQLAVINNVSIDIVRALLEYNADLSVLDSEGNNVLHLAVDQNRTDLVRIFLENLGSCDININQFNYDGLTPLMMCAFHADRIDMAELLLKNDAELNLRDQKSGRTAIFHAAESHNAPMVGLLLDYGADTKIRNFFGTSVHDAMFELEDMPREIKYPILGRDLKVHEKRKLYQQSVKKQDTFKRKKLEIVPTIQKLESKSTFVLNTTNVKQ